MAVTSERRALVTQRPCDSGSLAILAAIRRASSRVSSLAAGLESAGSLSSVGHHCQRALNYSSSLQLLRQPPAIQRQENCVQYQYGRQVQHKCVCDEGDIAANGDDTKVDHVLHAKGCEHQGRGHKSNRATVCCHCCDSAVRYDGAVVRYDRGHDCAPSPVDRDVNGPKMAGGALPRDLPWPSGRNRADVRTY